MNLLQRILGGLGGSLNDARAAVVANRDALEELRKEAERNLAQSSDVQRTVAKMMVRMGRRT